METNLEKSRDALTQFHPDCLVVLGMHRSGTSALSGVLSLLGGQAPATLISPNEENPKGFFESRKVVRLNESLLQILGLTWDNWEEADFSYCNSKQQDMFREKASDVLELEFGSADPIILKDPRLCRLQTVWNEVLEKAQRTTAFIHIHRHPDEVAKSLYVRNDIAPGFGRLLWLRYVLEAESGSRGKNRAFTSYPLLLQDWRSVVAKLETSLMLQFPQRPNSWMNDIEAFLCTNLHRQRRSDAESRNSLPGPLQEVYNILQRWSQEGEDLSDYEVLDEIHANFSAVTPLFLPPIRASVDLKKRLEETLTKQERDRKNFITSQRRAQLTVQDNEVTLQELAALKKTMKSAEERIRRRERDLASYKLTHQTLETHVATLETALENRDKDNGQLAQLHHKLCAQYDDLNLRFRQLSKQNRRIEKDIGQLQKEVAKAHFEKTEILMSRSWRWTAPLRRLATCLRARH